MNEKYLIINAGSSSLKLSLYEMPSATEIVNACVEKIGQPDSFYTLKYADQKIEKNKVITNHTEAVETMMDELKINSFINDITDIKGVGHRVLHGGEKYSNSVEIDDEVINDIINLTKLGPLHHPGNLAGIFALQKALPDVAQVAVFDTAFYSTIPEENYMYAVPYSWYEENGVRKYGFHGTSHKYITETVPKYLGNKESNIISIHIGSGCSMSAIKNGKCINTTMGLTPLDGLVMGTRSGSIDPSIIEYIAKEKNLTISDVNTILNKESGLKGISGYSDVRDVTRLANEGNSRAKLAIKLFEKSIIKYIAQFYFELEGKVDAIVFTAGVGENMAYIREDIVNYISDIMGITLNKELNDNIAKFKEYQSGVISTNDSKTKVIVIPTDEEYMILKDTYDICNKKEQKNYQKNLKK